MQTSIRTNVIIEVGIAIILILFAPTRGNGGRTAPSVMLVISAVVLMFVTLISDAIFGISGSRIFTLTAWAVGFGICAAVRLRYRSILSLVVAFFVTAFMLMLHFVDVLPVKPYKRFFGAIQLGMTDPEVMALLHREFPDRGSFPSRFVTISGQTKLASHSTRTRALGTPRLSFYIWRAVALLEKSTLVTEGASNTT